MLIRYLLIGAILLSASCAERQAVNYKRKQSPKTDRQIVRIFSNCIGKHYQTELGKYQGVELIAKVMYSKKGDSRKYQFEDCVNQALLQYAEKVTNEGS